MPDQVEVLEMVKLAQSCSDKDLEIIRNICKQLRQQGANHVMVLSQFNDKSSKEVAILLEKACKSANPPGDYSVELHQELVKFDNVDTLYFGDKEHAPDDFEY